MAAEPLTHGGWGTEFFISCKLIYLQFNLNSQTLVLLVSFRRHVSSQVILFLLPVTFLPYGKDHRARGCLKVKEKVLGKKEHWLLSQKLYPPLTGVQFSSLARGKGQGSAGRTQQLTWMQMPSTLEPQRSALIPRETAPCASEPLIRCEEQCARLGCWSTGAKHKSGDKM